MVNGVDAEFRPRAVAGSAGGEQVPADGPLVGVYEVQPGRLGHDGFERPLYPPRKSVFANRCTPRKVNSSSTVQAMTTRAAPAGFSRTTRAKAVSIDAMPPFTSQAPRP